MKKCTRNLIITACVAVVVVAAVLVGVFVGKPMVERHQVEQEFAAIQQRKEGVSSNPNLPESRKIMRYDEKIPLSEMDPHDLEVFITHATPAAGIDTAWLSKLLEETDYYIALPEDLHYYAEPDASAEPVYTIPKGTEILMYDEGFTYFEDYAPYGPYGCVCYPDYQKGWRYGKTFQTVDSGSTIEDALKNKELPYYYVQTKDLEKILGAFYEQKGLNSLESKEGYIDSYLHNIDWRLFYRGEFCSPELEHLPDDYIPLAEQLASLEE